MHSGIDAHSTLTHQRVGVLEAIHIDIVLRTLSNEPLNPGTDSQLVGAGKVIRIHILTLFCV